MQPNNTPRPTWFDDLLVKYTPFLLRQCSMRTQYPDDLLQDARMLAMMNWQRYPTNVGFASWLRFIVMSAHRGDRRKAIKTSPLEDWHDVPMPASQEHAADINLALRFCDSRQRSVVMMHSAGYLHREIARDLGISSARSRRLLASHESGLAAVNAKMVAARRVAA